MYVSDLVKILLMAEFSSGTICVTAVAQAVLDFSQALLSDVQVVFQGASPF